MIEEHIKNINDIQLGDIIRFLHEREIVVDYGFVVQVLFMDNRKTKRRTYATINWFDYDNLISIGFYLPKSLSFDRYKKDWFKE